MLLNNLFLSLLSAAVVATASYLLHYIWILYPKRFVRMFWNFDSKDDVLIVFPKTQKLPDHDDGRTTERSLNINSAIALSEVNKLLWEMKYRPKLVSSDTQISDLNSDANLILLGGTLGNPVCDKICERIRERLEVYWFGVRGRPDDHFLSSKDGGAFKTKFVNGETNTIECDHGLVLKFPNPLNTKNKIMVLAGNYGAGTLAAARASMDRSVLKKVKQNVSLNGNIGFVVKGYPKDFDVRMFELEGLPFEIKTP